MALSSGGRGHLRRHAAASRTQLGGEGANGNHARADCCRHRHRWSRGLSYGSGLGGCQRAWPTPSNLCNSCRGEPAHCRLSPRASKAADHRHGAPLRRRICGLLRWWWWRCGGACCARGRWGAALLGSAAEPLDRLRSRYGAACAALLPGRAQLHLHDGALRLLRATNHFAERRALKRAVHVVATRGAQG